MAKKRDIEMPPPVITIVRKENMDLTFLLRFIEVGQRIMRQKKSNQSQGA